MNNDCSILCINTSLKDAYKCLWHYKWNHLFISFIAFLPFTIVGLLGLFDPFFLPRFSHEQVPVGYNLSFILYILTTYLWGIPCVILWHRLYLLGPEHLIRRKIWPIITRSFVLMSKVLFLVGLCVLLAIILVSMLAFAISYFNLNDSISDFIKLTDNEFIRYMAIISIAGLVTYLVFLRFSLAICARTIGKKIGLRTSWRLTEKNTFRMFLSFMVVFLPATALSIALIYLYQYTLGLDPFYSGETLDTITYIHIFILAPAITLPISAMCSQCASFYRHCGGEDCSGNA
ncbi:MAG: hypothetical protein JKY84_03685 [Emcibacteraceae bacterium]|nr:hypothetical protein [Emcibacteraceae bacterium]